MSERLRSDSARYRCRYKTNFTKMSDSDLGTRKTLFVLVIVVGCFAVLWPKVFYPMLVGPTNQRMKPSNLDKGCCDVISDIDVNTIKIMSELCNNIVQRDKKPLKGQDIITQCRAEVLNKCGIDISAVLQEQVRLGRSFKQIVDEVRSFNGSLCLKYKFGVSPWRLGVSHRVSINLNPVYIRQERPTHLRPEMLHPALREKGRAIAQPYQSSAKNPPPKFVDGRPGPVPGVRPPMGGAGHVVHPPQKGINSMGIIMPIYTIGIVIFFSYTLMKLLFKKKPEGAGGNLYPPVEPSMTFRREVFESQKSRAPRAPGSRDQELDHLRRRLRETELAMERIVAQMAQVPLRSQKDPTSNGTLLANGSAKQSQEHEQPSVKVLGMEMTASCEGGEKWSRPESPIIPSSPPPPPEPLEPPQEIYLEGALPAQSQLLVADSTTEAETDADSSTADPAVVLASKMTLSVISLDSQESENGIEPVERVKLRNGDITDIDHEAFDDELIDESKYTTASGATAAERDISEEERTDGEDLEEEIEKVPECVVDNGVQQIEDIEDLQHDDLELHLEDDIQIEDVIVLESNSDDNDDIHRDPPVKIDESDIIGVKDIAEGGSVVLHESKPAEKSEIDEHKPTVKFSEEIEGDTAKTVKFMSPEAIESISDVIDDVINVGTRMSELRDNDKSKNEPEEYEAKRESAVKFIENVIDDDDDEKLEDIITAEDIESIGDVIDDVINVGTRMSELICAEKDAESDEPDEDSEMETGALQFRSENAKGEISENIGKSSETKEIVIEPVQLQVEPVQAEIEDEGSDAEVKPTEVNG